MDYVGTLTDEGGRDRNKLRESRENNIPPTRLPYLLPYPGTLLTRRSLIADCTSRVIVSMSIISTNR